MPVRASWDGTPTVSALADALREHNETLKGEVDLLKGQLVTERERADRAIADLTALAQRLADLAEAKPRSWWRRLTG